MFCNKPPGFPEEPGNCICVPSSQAVLTPAPQHRGCRLPRLGASNIPAVFFLPPGKAKAPNMPTRKIRTFVFNMNIALAKKMDWPVPVSPWSPSRGFWWVWGSRCSPGLVPAARARSPAAMLAGVQPCRIPSGSGYPSIL